MRVLVLISLLGLTSALLHSHASTQKKQKKNAYVTMKFVHAKHGPEADWKSTLMDNTLSEEQIETEAKQMFDSERADFVIKKARSFKARSLNTMISEEMLNEGSLPCSKRDPARQVNRLANQLIAADSKYPLVVYTNDECLANMTDLPKNIIIESNFKYLPRKCAMEGKNSMHFQKLGVFGLTQYDKLMWMDWDLQIKQNVDDLFEKDTKGGNTIYGQLDDWKCSGKKDFERMFSSASGGFCSGLMLYTPQASTVNLLLDNQGKNCWGDQVVIARTFDFHKTAETGREWKVWDDDVISFRGCQHKHHPRVVHHADLPGNDPGPAWK